MLKIGVITRQETEGRRGKLFGQLDFSLHVLVFFTLFYLLNFVRINPQERLIACRNPMLAADRAKTREELLAVTENVD